MVTNIALTDNGAVTNATSGESLTNLFFQIGTMRAAEKESVITEFKKAFDSNSLDALKIMFYSRDARQGQGERKTFRVILKWLGENHTAVINKNIRLIPEFGRWDDIFSLIGTPSEAAAISFIKEELAKKNATLAKWMPRQKSSQKDLANNMMRFLGLTAKEYRKTISAMTNVIESKMCSGGWSNIKFEAVPSVAMKNYRKAFQRHDTERWTKYIEDLVAGKAKVNAATLYPHDIVRTLLSSYDETESTLLEQQWKALPNYMANNNDIILPVCDVSGSMTGTPMDVCTALGLYISERNVGPFHNMFVTFSEHPEMQQLFSKDLKSRARELQSADWGMSTNLDAVFEVILKNAINNSVSKEKMPTKILILSDMQFNAAVVNGSNVSLMNAIRLRYEKSGYDLPKIVFWNLRLLSENFPVKFDEIGTAMVSGFSPSILKAILASKDMTPYNTMKETIDSERYSAVCV
jgi:hypothetical protein